MYAWLKEEFTKYERVAETLYPILTYMKSQEKRDPQHFKKLIYQFALAFEAAFPDKDAFNKLHFLFSHLPKFTELWEMIGIVNEESFEAFHSRLSMIKSLLKSIPSDSQRVGTINARMQSLLNEKIMELTLLIQSKTTGKKTGPQTRKRKRSDDNVENIATIFSETTVDEEDFIVLTNGERIPKKWKDIFLWFSSSKAPQLWVDIFNKNSNTESISSVKIANTHFSRL